MQYIEDDRVVDLLQEDVSQVVRRMPSALRDAMKHESFYGKIFLAGGAIRAIIAGEPVSDWDVLVSSKEVAESLRTFLECAARTEERAGRVVVTDNAITLTYWSRAIQIVHRWTFDTLEEGIQSFDFSISCAGIQFAPIPGIYDARFIGKCSWRFYPDLARKRLHYLAPEREEEAGGSMLRVMKFLRRGYSMSPESLSLVTTRWLSGVKDFEYLKSDRHRMTRMARLLSSLLREVDPMVIDPQSGEILEDGRQAAETHDAETHDAEK